MKGKTCCVTGHRDLPQNEINKIKAALEHEIDAAVTDGFTCFMSGFADGVDQYFAELVLERKQTNPALELIAVIPYRKRLDSLNKKTRNVRYYVKEKEPEPGAVRKGTSQPELDARSHEEVTPRNDASEKQNEIPGRQIPSQTDPLVEIRSAVHSNYAGMNFDSVDTS